MAYGDHPLDFRRFLAGLALHRPSNVVSVSELSWSEAAKRGYAALHRAGQEEAISILSLGHRCIERLPSEDPIQLEDGMVLSCGAFTAFQYLGRHVEVRFTHFHDKRLLRVLHVRPRRPHGGPGGTLLPIGGSTPPRKVRELCDAGAGAFPANLWAITTPSDRAFLSGCEDRLVFRSHGPLAARRVVVRAFIVTNYDAELDRVAQSYLRGGRGFAASLRRICQRASDTQPAVFAYAAASDARAHVLAAGVSFARARDGKSVIVLAPEAATPRRYAGMQAVLAMLAIGAGVGDRNLYGAYIGGDADDQGDFSTSAETGNAGAYACAIDPGGQGGGHADNILSRARAGGDGAIVVVPEGASAPLLSSDGAGGDLSALQMLGAVGLKAMPTHLAMALGEMMGGIAFQALTFDGGSMRSLRRSFAKLCSDAREPIVRSGKHWTARAPSFTFDALQLRLQFNLVDRLAALLRTKD
ncbi:MAG: hypothetical protein WDM79_18720 [Terricaulis sp.]